MVDARLALGRSELVADDLLLVKRCREGDENAMGMMIQRHRLRLIRTAANLMRDRHEAEDITQEAFLKAFR
ncbi:MAG: sigma factor, partial [Fimbriimonadaceae bacterium]